jgi:protein-tyrosine phosphatase
MVASNESHTEPDATGSRLVALQGGSNFRDIGGYRTTDGGSVRWGRVYRSAALDRLTGADLATVDRLGLRVVYDLRREQERERAPSLLPDGLSCEWLPIGGAAAKTRELTDLLVEGRVDELPPDFLERIYDGMADAAALTFGRLLTALAEPAGTPALIHCTAGKDRTGMSVALLLSVLGVAESDILDDYELSGVHFTEGIVARLRLRDADVDITRLMPVLGAPRHAMASLLAKLRGRHGSVEGYLVTEAGVSPGLLEELRIQLVEVGDGD